MEGMENTTSGNSTKGSSKSPYSGKWGTVFTSPLSPARLIPSLRNTSPSPSGASWMPGISLRERLLPMVGGMNAPTEMGSPRRQKEQTELKSWPKGSDEVDNSVSEQLHIKIPAGSSSLSSPLLTPVSSISSISSNFASPINTPVSLVSSRWGSLASPVSSTSSLASPLTPTSRSSSPAPITNPGHGSPSSVVSMETSFAVANQESTHMSSLDSKNVQSCTTNTMLTDNELSSSPSLHTDGETSHTSNITSLLAVNDLHKRQMHINSVNEQLVKLHCIASFLLCIKQSHVKKTISDGQRRLEKLNKRLKTYCSTIAFLQKSVISLQMTAKNQSEQAYRMKKSLHSQTQIMSLYMQQVHCDINRLHGQVAVQEKVINKLMAERLKHDLLIDSCIFLYCIYLTNSAVVDLPLHTLLRMVDQRHRKWLQPLSKVLITLSVFGVLRNWSTKFGLHYRVGSCAMSIKQFVSCVYQYCQTWRRKEISDEKTSEKECRMAFDVC